MQRTRRILKNTSPLCCMSDGCLVCYQQGDIVIIEDGKVTKRFQLLSSIMERIVGRSRVIARLLRLGVRTAESIDDDSITLSIGNMLYELNIRTGELSNGYFCGEGVRPLILTTVMGINGFEDGIYFGGYLCNEDKEPVNVYHRVGVDNWEVVYTFPQGTINHVHAIVGDTYRKCLWIFTGDFDDSSAIWKVTEGFKKVERVAFNDQKYRGCVAFVLPEGLLYATDAPFADDYIFLMNTESYEIEEICPIDGSCIYGCQWKDTFVFSSTVEADGRNLTRKEWLFTRRRGPGIKDNYVHMYCGNLKVGFREIYKEEKDCMPFFTFQFGVFKFPHDHNNSSMLYFQPVATKYNDLDLMAYSE